MQVDPSGPGEAHWLGKDEFQTRHQSKLPSGRMKLGSPLSTSPSYLAGSRCGYTSMVSCIVSSGYCWRMRWLCPLWKPWREGSPPSSKDGMVALSLARHCTAGATNSSFLSAVLRKNSGSPAQDRHYTIMNPATLEWQQWGLQCGQAKSSELAGSQLRHKALLGTVAISQVGLGVIPQPYDLAPGKASSGGGNGRRWGCEGQLGGEESWRGRWPGMTSDTGTLSSLSKLSMLPIPANLHVWGKKVTSHLGQSHQRETDIDYKFKRRFPV